MTRPLLRRQARGDVGRREVRSLEQQRLAAELAQRVSEAVTEIEGRTVVALAEAPVRLTRDPRLLLGHRLDPHAEGRQQGVERRPLAPVRVVVRHDTGLEQVPADITRTGSSTIRW